MTGSQWRELRRGWHGSVWVGWRPDELLHSGVVGGVWLQMLEGQPRESYSFPGGTKPSLGPGAGSSRGSESGKFSGCCIGRICMTGSPLRCSRRGTVGCSSPLLHRALQSPGCPLGKWRNPEGQRLEQAWRSFLSPLGWALDGGCPSGSGCHSGKQIWSLKPVCQMVRRRK